MSMLRTSRFYLPNGMWSLLYFVGLLFLLQSCGVTFKESSSIKFDAKKIGGTVTPLVGLIAANDTSWFGRLSYAYAAVCPDPVYAFLHKIETDGSINENSWENVQRLGPDAKYSFDLGQGIGTNVEYLVRVKGCNNLVLDRPVTNIDLNQEVSYGTTLIATIVQTVAGNKLNEVSRQEVNELLASVNGATSITNAYSIVDSDVTTSTKFSHTFGITHSNLLDAAPRIVSVTAPLTGSELAVINYAVVATHFNGSYVTAYEWKIDGVLQSQTDALSWIPSKNDQGSHVITLAIGRDDGSGNLDYGLPYKQFSYVVIVDNNFKPISPGFSVSGSSIKTSQNVTLNIDTGASLVNCESFQALAFTQNDNAIPSPADFTYTCVTPTTQTEAYTLSAGDGTKVLRLWAIDSSGVISLIPTSVTLTLDTVAPTLSFSSPAASSYINATNKSSFILSGACSEEGRAVTISGAASASPNCTSGAFTATFDLTAVADGTVTFYADHTDAAGLTATQASRSFTKDTGVPSITQTTYSSGSYSTANTVVFGGSCETGTDILITGVDSTTIGCTSSSWTYTTASKTSDGTYSYTFEQQDAAGNSDSVSGSWIRDASAPSLTSLSIANGAASLSTINATVQLSATDNISVSHIRLANANAVTEDCQSEYANNNWQIYSGGSQTYNHIITSGDGVKKICAWAKDPVGNVSLISPSSGQLGIDSDTVLYEVGTPPQITAFSVVNNTAGVNYGTTKFNLGDQVLISWTATDLEGFASSPISLYYTTNNTTWLPIVVNYGPASPTSPYSSTYSSFTAPTASFFRLKIVVKDLANNTNFETFSPPLNSGNWQLYAGTTSMGIGGNYNSVQLKKNNFGVSSGQVAVNPKNNDLYYISFGVGILKGDAITGKVDYFIRNGTNNLPTTGVLSSSSLISTNDSSIRFDKDGLLYLKEGTRFYRIDPVTLSVVQLFGGTGTTNTGPYSAANIAVLGGSTFDIDLNKNLYFYVDCFEATGSWGNNSNNTAKIVKATYDSDSDLYSFSDYAGNCILEDPPVGGTAVLTQGLGRFRHKHLMNIAVNGNGSILYYGDYNARKILNGLLYDTSLDSRGLYFDKNTNELYSSNGPLYKHTGAALASNNSEGSTPFIPVSAGVGCNEDGVSVNSACVNIYHGNAKGEVYVGYSSDVYFIDIGPRVRFISSSTNKVYTALGSKPLYGDGLDKQFLRAQSLGGIYYKPASAPNQAAFPEGLYFTDEYSLAIGHIHPTTGVVSVIAGNQSLVAETLSGKSFDVNVSLGLVHEAHNLASLTFDSNGLPWFVSGSGLRTVSSSLLIEDRQTGSGVWSHAVQGDNPANFNSSYNLGTGNLVTAGNGVFVLGNAKVGTDMIKGAVIQYHDYGSSIVEHLIGGATLPTQGYSADNTTPGSTPSLTLSATCNDRSRCFLEYISSTDRLYFSEDTRLRYLTTPSDPSTSTLGTLFTVSRNIRSFIFSLDQEQVYYVSSNGLLYCYDLPGGTAPAHCNDTSLGPFTGFSTISTQGNQMTWKSATELLINNATGEIYLFTVP